MNQNQIKSPDPRKGDWIRPEFKRLEAGAAESQRGGTADGGGGNQGS